MEPRSIFAKTLQALTLKQHQNPHTSWQEDHCEIHLQNIEIVFNSKLGIMHTLLQVKKKKTKQNQTNKKT